MNNTTIQKLVSSTGKVVAQHLIAIAEEEREKDNSKFTVENIIRRVQEEYKIK